MRLKKVKSVDYGRRLAWTKVSDMNRFVYAPASSQKVGQKLGQKRAKKVFFLATQTQRNRCCLDHNTGSADSDWLAAFPGSAPLNYYFFPKNISIYSIFPPFNITLNSFSFNINAFKKESFKIKMKSLVECCQGHL